MRGLYSTRRAQTQGHATSRHWNAFSRFSDWNSGNCALVELLVFLRSFFFQKEVGVLEISLALSFVLSQAQDKGARPLTSRKAPCGNEFAFPEKVDRKNEMRTLNISSILLSAPKRSAERTDPRPHFFTSRPCVHRRDREPSWTSNTHICKSDQQCNFRSAVLFLRRPSLQLAWRQQRGCDSAAFSHHCFWSVSTHFFLFARLFWNNRSMGYARLSWPFSGLT